MQTTAKVHRIRVSRRQQAGVCNYCWQQHEPPLAYWYAIYAYLAGW